MYCGAPPRLGEVWIGGDVQRQARREPVLDVDAELLLPVEVDASGLADRSGQGEGFDAKVATA